MKNMNERQDVTGWNFETKRVKDLKRGEWFTIRPLVYPDDNQVYIRDEYDRSTKRYVVGRCDDCGYSREMRGDKVVYTNFIY